MAMLPRDSSRHGIVESSPYRITKSGNEPAGKLGASWYFSRKEIEENSPSKRDGIDLKKESYLRKSYCTYLQDLGIRLKVPQVTIATSIVLCHRFYLRQSHAKNDRRTIATVCMFLAGKVEETPRPLKDVIMVSYELIHKKDPAAGQKIKQRDVYDRQKELILLGERVVLATLGFDLNVHHPYKPLVERIKKFKITDNALLQVAWNFVNDGLRTSLCLQFKPHHIAAGALFLAGKFLKVKFLPDDGEKAWYQEFDVSPRQLEEVSNQMLELYEQNRVVQSQPTLGKGAEGGSASVPNQGISVKAQVKSEEPPVLGHHQASKQLEGSSASVPNEKISVKSQVKPEESPVLGHHQASKQSEGSSASVPNQGISVKAQAKSEEALVLGHQHHQASKQSEESSASVPNQGISVKAQVKSEEPPVLVHHQASKQSDSNHSTSTGVPTHNGGEHSDPDKQIGSQESLHNVNGDHGIEKTSSQSGRSVDSGTKDGMHDDTKSLPGSSRSGDKPDIPVEEHKPLPSHASSRSSDKSDIPVEEQKPLPSQASSCETRDGNLSNNDGPSVSSSMIDAMNKIDKDKVKAALEKRRKLKGDVARKVDVVDDDDLLEGELEHGLELAVEDEKIKKERDHASTHQEDHRNADDVAEDVEQNAPETAKEAEVPVDVKEERSATKRNDGFEQVPGFS